MHSMNEEQQHLMKIAKLTYVWYLLTTERCIAHLLKIVSRNNTNPNFMNPVLYLQWKHTGFLTLWVVCISSV